MMGLTFKLLQRPRQIMALRCTVCRTYLDPEDDSQILAKLVGHVKYSICSGCGTEVGPGLMNDRYYRCRWTRRVNKLSVDK